MPKITIDGHGGHLCEAWLDNTGISEVGETIEEAVGRLVSFHPKKFGIELEVLPCSTTAYERSACLEESKNEEPMDEQKEAKEINQTIHHDVGHQ